MRRFICLLAALSVPALLFLNIHQVFRYDEYKRELTVLEEEQENWVESNKRVISSIMIYSSPGRIAALAEGSFDLIAADPEDVILLQVGGGSGE